MFIVHSANMSGIKWNADRQKDRQMERQTERQILGSNINMVLMFRGHDFLSGLV